MSLESMHFLSDESGLKAQSACLSVGGNAAISSARDVCNYLLFLGGLLLLLLQRQNFNLSRRMSRAGNIASIKQNGVNRGFKTYDDV